MWKSEIKWVLQNTKKLLKLVTSGKHKTNTTKEKIKPGTIGKMIKKKAIEVQSDYQIITLSKR